VLQDAYTLRMCAHAYEWAAGRAVLRVWTAYERISGDYKLGITIYMAAFMEAILGMAL
jgi:hypothetical protein